MFKKKSPLLEKKPLPVGKQEFEAWASNIIELTGIPAKDDSQKFVLASMITSLGNTEAFKEDAYFINALRKAAANQVAVAMMEEIRENRKKEPPKLEQ